MTDGSDPAVLQLPTPPNPPDDPIFDFDISTWIDPPVYVTNLPETTPESNIRAMAEMEYRKSTTPTAWHRYVTLGRYVVDGFTFDSIMDEGSADPLKMYCLVWYQYAYHLDHEIDIPPKLQAWGTRKAQPFLATHAISAFTLDTKTTSWKDFSRSQSLSNPWSEVTPKQRKPKNRGTPLAVKPSGLAVSARGTRSNPGTIAEENSKNSDSTDSRGQQRPVYHVDDNSAASNAKQSVLIPNLNVPVCDGTHRVTLRWKTSLDITRLSRQTQEMKEEIYKLLDDIFDDDDGLLYRWQHAGTDIHNLISKMTPSEVRQFICPSIGILPSLSMIVIPIRFGFSSNTPAKWRNLPSTQEKLEKYNVTVSFSNCTSTSGNLVVAGFILLKAPMTTHRLRYLQSLRQQLPETTPPFDILLHKRTPFDQQIPHLAVQCGHKHVHSLSEALANILTGDGSALYIPRFVLSQMATSDAESLFTTHDAHVKSLRWLPLFPLLSNLDKPRKEYLQDGSVIERTTREWARTIKNITGTALAQCDVVNGGLDQLCYLLFPPQHLEAATNALDEYRKCLYPFSQREARFRESIGPPPVIHMSKSVIANLDFIKNLSTQNLANASRRQQTDTSNDNSSEASPESGITYPSSSKATRPLTPAESLRLRYSNRTLRSEATESLDDELTSASTETAPSSKLSDGRMSTSMAKLRELDAVIQRQKQLNDKKDAKNSERISLIERQLHRLDDLDKKLDDVKNDFGTRLTLFEQRMVATVKTQMESSHDNVTNMNSTLTQLMNVVSHLVEHRSDPKGETRTHASGVRTTTRTTNEILGRTSIANAASSSQQSHSSSSRSSMSAESTGCIQSPEHKRPRSGKKPLKESIRRQLDQALEAASNKIPTPCIDSQESLDSLDLAMQQMEEIVTSNRVNADASDSKHDNTDHESHYTASSQTPEEQNTNATPSPGRKSTS